MQTLYESIHLSPYFVSVMVLLWSRTIAIDTLFTRSCKTTTNTYYISIWIAFKLVLTSKTNFFLRFFLKKHLSNSLRITLTLTLTLSQLTRIKKTLGFQERPRELYHCLCFSLFVASCQCFTLKVSLSNLFMKCWVEKGQFTPKSNVFFILTVVLFINLDSVGVSWASFL